MQVIETEREEAGARTRQAWGKLSPWGTPQARDKDGREEGKGGSPKQISREQIRIVPYPLPLPNDSLVPRSLGLSAFAFANSFFCFPSSRSPLGRRRQVWPHYVRSAVRSVSRTRHSAVPALLSRPMSDGSLVIAGRTFRSRLILGTGKFSSPEAMRDALAASDTEMVTVALRRADLSGKGDPFANILDFIDPKKYLLLPNTSGAMNAEEAVRLARLAVAAGLPKWVKLEIHPDPRYLLPDPIETLKAAEILVKEGFTVLPYINADPVLAKRLQEVGTATVMPLGSPIGSNRGIQTRDQIRIIIEQATVPVVVDAGIGAPSHAAEAMELGADAVLVNTAIAVAADPNRMAIAFKQATEAGRTAYEIGLAAQLNTASATSPLTAFLD